MPRLSKYFNFHVKRLPLRFVHRELQQSFPRPRAYPYTSAHDKDWDASCQPGKLVDKLVHVLLDVDNVTSINLCLSLRQYKCTTVDAVAMRISFTRL